MPLGPTLNNYYLPDIEMFRDMKKVAPDFQTEQSEYRALRLLKFKRSGRGTPKKGQGKRASRKK
eukprot:gene18717-24478_t